MTDLEEGDAVLCTVDRIVGTIVFVKIEEGGDGSIVLSEIAPGRIRNLRDYVIPKKKIVCKVLNIDNKENIHLSLRRVTQKEKKEIMEKYEHEKSSINILKSILKEKAEGVIKEISKEKKVSEFLKEAVENPKKLEKLVEKKDSEKILDILKAQKSKKFVIKKEINLKIIKSNGLELIKQILNTKEAEIKYIAAGKYSIKLESDNPKTTDNKLKEIIFSIEKEAKKHGTEFSIKEK